MPKRGIPSPEERAAWALTELRGATREAHELLRDLKATTAAAQFLVDSLRRFLESEIRERVEDVLSAEVARGIAQWQGSLSRSVDESERRITDRFTNFMHAMLGAETEDGETFETVLTAFIQRQQFLEARQASLPVGALLDEDLERYAKKRKP